MDFGECSLRCCSYRQCCNVGRNTRPSCVRHCPPSPLICAGRASGACSGARRPQSRRRAPLAHAALEAAAPGAPGEEGAGARAGAAGVRAGACAGLGCVWWRRTSSCVRVVGCAACGMAGPCGWLAGVCGARERPADTAYRVAAAERDSKALVLDAASSLPPAAMQRQLRYFCRHTCRRQRRAKRRMACERRSGSEQRQRRRRSEERQTRAPRPLGVASGPREAVTLGLTCERRCRPRCSRSYGLT